MMFYRSYFDAAVLMPGTFYHVRRENFYTFNLLNCLILLNNVLMFTRDVPILSLQSYKWLKVGFGMSVARKT